MMPLATIALFISSESEIAMPRTFNVAVIEGDGIGPRSHRGGNSPGRGRSRRARENATFQWTRFLGEQDCS